MSDIIVENVRKSFGDTEVLNNFSAVFKEGRTTCIMGDSGCGKTTLLNLLMGLEDWDEGQITGVPERKSAVFQEDRLCEAFGAVSNVGMVMEKRGFRKQAEAHLKELGIEAEDFNKPVAEFSGGMKRRVALARAVLAGGDILFMDEPFKGLDPATRKTVISYVKKYTLGKTVILVTHDEAEAVWMGGDRIRMKKA